MLASLAAQASTRPLALVWHASAWQQHPWMLWTASLVHLSPAHLLVNLGGLLVLAVLGMFLRAQWPATLAVVPDVPVAGMTLILGVDRFMSECRALTNFVGNAVATVVVSRWDGQLDRERLLTVLGNPTLVHEPALIGPHPDD